MRPIDADVVYELFSPFSSAFTDPEVMSAYLQTLQLISNATSTDAVNVVRCKDCRFGTWDEDVEMYSCVVIDGCWFEAHHYCRDGERKESE